VLEKDAVANRDSSKKISGKITGKVNVAPKTYLGLGSNK
jgi:hypothetical protein